MNEKNYASLESSKRLVDAGIVLDTDMYWIRYSEEAPYRLATFSQATTTINNIYPRRIPAPTMVEVWREMKGISVSMRLCIDGSTCVWLQQDTYQQEDINPADALIDLLIWEN